ncbi:hypothetical protein VPHD81_0112 [Vibrio phage D81]
MFKLNRDKVREAIAKAGITTDNVTLGQLESLYNHIDKAMRESDCYDGTMRMNNRKDVMYMTCRTNEWESREAVSFNRDGFIGFAGWADDNNVQPILRGVMRWLLEV